MVLSDSRQLAFSDRREGGLVLARKLEKIYGQELVGNATALVMAIPRGGVVTGDAVAEHLHIKMDVVISRKVGAPSNPELAIGAVTPDGEFFANEDIIQATGATKSYITEQVARQRKEIKRRLLKFRGSMEYDLDGKTIILVDDGIATGATMFAAINWLKKRSPRKLVASAPVGSPDTISRLERAVDDVVVLHAPDYFHGVGQFFQDFSQVQDDEVVRIMKKYREPRERNF